MQTDVDAGAMSARVGVRAGDAGGCPVSHASDSPVDVTAEAVEFLHLYHEERRLPGVADRVARVREEIAVTGTYRHTGDELVHGAKVAWRQSARCVGRVRWAGLRVRDRRGVTTVAGIAEELARHLAVADNGGRIQSVMTVFAPDRPGWVRGRGSGTTS